MSILVKRRYLFEDGEEDNQTGNDTGTTPTVDTQDDTGGDTDNTEDTGTEDNNNTEEENADDQNTDDNQEENTDDEDQNEDNDYDIDTEPDEENNTEDTGDEGSEGNEDNIDSDSSTSNEDKELDRQMFDSLSDSEKERKIATLKKLYMELYSKCNILIDKFNQITNDGNDDFKPVIKRILTVLYDLKEYVSYYLLNVYDNNSYIENDVNFNRYLSVLNGIKHITEELQKEKKKEVEEAQ